MFGFFHGWYLFGALFWLVVVGIPIAKILDRSGVSPWWTLTAFVPGLNVIMLWVFATMRWPASGGR